MSRCSRLKQASVYSATAHKLPNQSKLMTQPAYAKEPSPEKAEQVAYTQDEKCELLSAYIDGECSCQERQLVEHWLASDLQMQQQYQAQLKLQLAIKTCFQAE